jgi:hypothetical protein
MVWGRSSDFPQSALPSRQLVSGVIQADLSKEDYSCRYSSGLSPDSLTSGGFGHQIAIYSLAKIQLFSIQYAYFTDFF